jgi:hypothetical protein
MKRSIALLPAPACSALVLLTSCLFLVAGCSEGPGTAADATASAPGGLEESEVVAIAKTAKTQKVLMAEIRKKTMEKEGVVIPTKRSGNATQRPR